MPYGYTNDFFDVYATYGKGLLGLEAGWKINGLKRTFRETDKTTENVFRGGGGRARELDRRSAASASSARATTTSYDAVRAEEESFIPVPGGAAGQPDRAAPLRPGQARPDAPRRALSSSLPARARPPSSPRSSTPSLDYDQDAVPCQDVEHFSGQSQFCPGGVQAPLGMVHDKYDTFTLEASFAPGERWNAYAFYSYEDGDILQNGRQSGSTLNFNPADVWTSNIVNKGNTFGAGLDFTLVPEKWFLGLVGRYQKVDGNNDVTLRPGFSTSIYSTAGLRPVRGDPGALRASRRSTTPSSPPSWARSAISSPSAGARAPGSASRTTSSTTPRPATPSTTCPRPSSCRPTTGTTRPGWVT